MTLDQMIARLEQIRRTDTLRRDWVVHICVPEFEFQPVTRVDFEESDDGGVILIESERLNRIIDTGVDK
jgi:hypothetical protein